MSKLEFSNLEGIIRSAPLKAYDRITSKYLEKVSRVDAIHGIVKIGSVSCPGLSDIDIIVIIDETKTAPKWEEICIKDIAAADPHGSIIAHDVFVITKEIAKYISAFFYVDNQTILHGEGFSSIKSSDISPHLTDILTFEYTCHRLESLFHLVAAPRVDLRTALLLISTLRHTADLASELQIINHENALELITSIETLRKNCIEVSNCSDDLTGWPEKCLRLLWLIAAKLGDRLIKTNGKDLKSIWSAGPKQSIFDINSGDAPIELWSDFARRHKKSVLGRRVKTIPMPIQYHQHISLYLGQNCDAANDFKATFPSIEPMTEENETLSSVRKLRINLVKLHWNFIDENHFRQCSGKGYFGLNMPPISGTKINIYKMLNFINSRLIKINYWS